MAASHRINAVLFRTGTGCRATASLLTRRRNWPPHRAPASRACPEAPGETPRPRIGRALCAAALSLGLSAQVAPAACVDVSLVLAIDSSGSIDDGEFALQVMGYAAAFQSREVQRALAASGVVDVAVVYWADSDFGFQTIPWHRITSPQDAEVVAATILSTPHRLSGDTDIGNGLSMALDLLDDPGRCSIRSIINVSGDGRESLSAKRSFHIPLAVARDRATRMGVVVNALAILNDDQGLEQYYRTRLISGPGAFAMAVADFTAFGTAIRQKLVREIGLQLSSSLDARTLHPQVPVP